MKEIRILSATGILGSGFREETMKRAMTLKPDFIGSDAGSSDPGPHHLGSGQPQFSDAACKRDLRLMIMVITIQHAVGGDLPAILTTLADTMRQRREMREEVLAATAQSRASALIITLLPIAVALFGYFVLPDYFRPLFTNVVGWLILVVAGVLLTTGTLIIRRMTTIA